MTASVVIELSFPFMCSHVALKPNAGCADSTTRGTREIDGSASGCCDWIALCSSAVATRSFSNTLGVCLARSFSIGSCPEHWIPTCRCLYCRVIESALE